MANPERHAEWARISEDIELFESEMNDRMAIIGATVRNACQAQLETWQQIPFLALQADGKSGYRYTERILYERGLFRVVGYSESGGYSSYVDCEDGDIVEVVDDFAKAKPLTDVKVYGLKDMLRVGAALDAETQLAYYQEQATRPYIKSYLSDSARSLGLHAEQVEDKKQEKIRILGLTAIYSRPEDIEDRIAQTEHLYLRMIHDTVI